MPKNQQAPAGPPPGRSGTRRTRTRVPPGEGGPANLVPTRAQQKSDTLHSAEIIFAKLKELELPLSEDSWKVAKAAADPRGASWRSTYRKHVAHLFAELRDPCTSGGLTETQAMILRNERDRALKCVQEHAEDIERLKDRIRELEAESAKLSRGTRSRRRRKPFQDRQAPSDETVRD